MLAVSSRIACDVAMAHTSTITQPMSRTLKDLTSSTTTGWAQPAEHSGSPRIRHNNITYVSQRTHAKDTNYHIILRNRGREVTTGGITAVLKYKRNVMKVGRFEEPS
jgi:hypothetical protein